MQRKDIVIGLSKGKIILLTLGSFGFVALGFWLLDIASSQTRYNEFKVIITAIASIAFFGMCGIYGLIKIFDNKPGIIINQRGILDNSSAVSGQLIKWENVLAIEDIDIQGTRILLIHVDNMEEVLAIATPWKRFWMKLSIKWYGTPISLSSSSLKCSFDELKNIIEKQIEQNTKVQHGL